MPALGEKSVRLVFSTICKDRVWQFDWPVLYLSNLRIYRSTVEIGAGLFDVGYTTMLVTALVTSARNNACNSACIAIDVLVRLVVATDESAGIPVQMDKQQFATVQVEFFESTGSQMLPARGLQDEYLHP